MYRIGALRRLRFNKETTLIKTTTRAERGIILGDVRTRYRLARRSEGLWGKSCVSPWVEGSLGAVGEGHSYAFAHAQVYFST